MNNKNTKRERNPEVLKEVFQKFYDLLPQLAKNLDVDTGTIDRLRGVLEANPGIFEIQGKNGKTLGMRASELGLAWLAGMALICSERSGELQDSDGRIAGMYAIKFEQRDVLLKAVKNTRVYGIQDRRGYNLTMCLIEAGWDKEAAALIARTKNLPCATQVENMWNENAGMLAAKYKCPLALNEALSSSKMREQKDRFGTTMENIAKGNGMAHIVNNFWALQELKATVKDIESSLKK